MNKIISLGFLWSILFLQCGTPNPPKTEKSTGENVIKYAKRFSLEHFDGYSILRVNTPWPEAEEAFEYVLYPKNQDKPKLDDQQNFIPVPLERLAITSTTHLAFLEQLQALSLIKGMSGTKYAYSDAAKRNIESNEIQEIGLDNSINYEQVLALETDALLTYSISSGTSIEEAKNMGIQPIVIAEFMDQSPLGRAEWIRFFGALIGKQALADSIFQACESEYLSLQSRVSGLDKPSVFTGMGFKGTWYVPGGNSYVARSIQDAGGDYIWKDTEGQLSKPMDLEAVFEKAVSADKWINVGQVFALADIEAVDPRYNKFESWQAGEVFNGTKRVSSNGGYDIYESAVVNPDLVLRDLIQIFHPQLLESDSLYYYVQLR